MERKLQRRLILKLPQDRGKKLAIGDVSQETNFFWLTESRISKHKIEKTIFAAVLLLVFSSGCVNYSPRIQPNDRLEQSKGYIYGLFNIAPESGQKLSMYLVVSSVDKSQYYIFPFEQQAIPYVIAVNPGDYFIEKIIFGEKRKEKKISSSFSKPFFSVEAGRGFVNRCAKRHLGGHPFQHP